VYRSVAQIAVELEVGQAIGTAFAIRNINNNTYMVTVNHLCESRFREVVAFSASGPGPGRNEFIGKTVYINPENDLCIIRLYDTGEQFIPLKFAEEPPIAGDRIFTIGSPSGAFPTKTDGYVVGHDLLGMVPEGTELGADELKVLLVTSVPAFSGNSGGPLYNERHEVVGMISATHKRYPHSSISVHYEAILKHLKVYFKKDFK
jgi:S1-C subfamily serine protease